MQETMTTRKSRQKERRLERNRREMRYDWIAIYFEETISWRYSFYEQCLYDMAIIETTSGFLGCDYTKTFQIESKPNYLNCASFSSLSQQKDVHATMQKRCMWGRCMGKWHGTLISIYLMIQIEFQCIIIRGRRVFST